MQARAVPLPQYLGVPSPTIKVVPERVREARLAAGFKSAAALARAAGLSQPTIWELENGITKEAKFSTVHAVAQATRRPISFFTDAVDNPELTPVTSARVPVISWVQAGRKNAVHDPYQPGTADKWEPVSVRASKSAFALRVRGDSMVAPDGTGFPEDTIIVIEPETEPRNGDFVVVRFNDADEATFKRLVIDGPSRFLKPLNPAYPAIPISSDATICGVVVESKLIRRYR